MIGRCEVWSLDMKTPVVRQCEFGQTYKYDPKGKGGGKIITDVRVTLLPDEAELLMPDGGVAVFKR
mgnify:CR=1 FL=1